MRYGVNNLPIPQKNLMTLISAVRSSSVTDNLRGGGIIPSQAMKFHKTSWFLGNAQPSRFPK